MRHNSIHLPLALLVPVLAAAVVVVPVAPELHQAFADHDHILCSQHHRIEDLGLKRERHIRIEPILDLGMSLASPQAGKRPNGDTPPCGVSNLHAQCHRPAVASPLLGLARVSTGATRIPDLDIPPRSPLIVAPKHSPPDSFSN